MVNKQYKWRRQLAPIAAAVVGEELEKIRQNSGGKLLPEVVVDEARSEESPLHPAFEWDDTTAAEEYRIGQARQIIRAVHVVVIGTKPPKTRPVFVHINKGKNDKYYQSAAVAVRNVDEYQAALAELRSKVDSAVKAVNDLNETAKEVGAKRPLNRVSKALLNAQKELKAM